MPSKPVPAQQLTDAGEDLVRLAAAKDEEIATLTEQRDAALAARDGETLRAQGANAAMNEAIRQRDAMKAALVHVEAVMSMVRPRSDMAEYLETLGEVRAALDTPSSPLSTGADVNALRR